MKALFFSLVVCLSTLITLQAQEAYLPLSVTNRAAENAYHGATYLASNVNLEKGRVEIDRALELDPDFFMAHVYLYQVFADDEEKPAIAKKALAVDPTNFTKAEKIMRRQMEVWAEEAEAAPTAAMEELVAAYPQTTEAYEWAYLHAAYTENNMESAYGYAQKLLQLDSNFGPAYNFLGYYYMGAKEMDKAKAAFEKYIELNEMEANAYDSMGEFYLTTGDYEKSAEYYERAVDLGFENSQGGANRAHAAQRQQIQDNLDNYEMVWDKIVNDGDLDQINSTYFTEDITMIASPENVVGIEAFKDYYRNFITGFSDIRFTIIDKIGQGNQIAKHWRFQGTHTGDFFGIPATGHKVDIEGSTMAIMKDGRIAQEQDFMDNVALLQQLGLLSDPNNIGVIDGLYQAFAKGDIPFVLSILDEKVVWNEAEGNALADGNPYIGPDAVLNGVFARIGAEHEYFNLKDIKLHTMDGNQVLATLRYDAKRNDNGALIDAQVAHLWTLSDGKVTAFQQYVDTKQLADAAASQ